jgi:hypothetical protein
MGSGSSSLHAALNTIVPNEVASPAERKNKRLLTTDVISPSSFPEFFDFIILFIAIKGY